MTLSLRAYCPEGGHRAKFSCKGGWEIQSLFYMIIFQLKTRGVMKRADTEEPIQVPVTAVYETRRVFLNDSPFTYFLESPCPSFTQKT